MLQAASSRVRFSMKPSDSFFNLPNPSSCTMGLGCTQSLTKVSTRPDIFLRGKERPARRADNLTAICEPTVYEMWKPQHPTNLWACYMENVYSHFCNDPLIAPSHLHLSVSVAAFMEVSPTSVYMYIHIFY
jgi:hypothetical protein